MEYEFHQELVSAENEDQFRELMSDQGWTFVTDEVVDVATGRHRLEFKRPKQ
jgi:hypothetical protein